MKILGKDEKIVKVEELTVPLLINGNKMPTTLWETEDAIARLMGRAVTVLEKTNKAELVAVIKALNRERDYWLPTLTKENLQDTIHSLSMNPWIMGETFGKTLQRVEKMLKTKGKLTPEQGKEIITQETPEETIVSYLTWTMWCLDEGTAKEQSLE